MAHILSTCPALAQTKYVASHDAVLKILFFEILLNLGLIDTVPPCYLPIKAQPVYETVQVQAYLDSPVYGEFQELKANRIDSRPDCQQPTLANHNAGDQLPLGEQT